MAAQQQAAGGGAWTSFAINSNRGLASAFLAAAVADSELGSNSTAPLSSTLSGLLSGIGQAEGPDKICISPLPLGVGESAIRAECARHGAVTSVVIQAETQTAYVCFAAPEMADMAQKRMGGKILFGGTIPTDVQLISEMPEKVRFSMVVTPQVRQEPINEKDLPEYLKPKKTATKHVADRGRRSKSGRKKKKDKKKKKKDRSRSMVRWLDRSRSNSHTGTGQYIRATGCSSTVKWWEKKGREESSSSSASESSSSHRRKRSRSRKDDNRRSFKEGPAQKSSTPVTSKRPRQVGVKGVWAQFVHGGASYYYNIATQQTTFDRPSDLDSSRPGRSTEAVVARAKAAVKLVGTTGATSMLL